MNIAIFFWVLYILLVIFSVMYNYPYTSWQAPVTWVLLLLIIALLGYKVFGPLLR